MKPAFKLDAHPRRPHSALSEPPAGYFDHLPAQVMRRLPQADAPAPGWHWLARLAPGLRTGLVAAAVLGGFAASFHLSGPAAGERPPAAGVALDAVPRAELVGYLLTSGATVETVDLAGLAAARPGVSAAFLRASATEVAEAMDAQPSEDPALYIPLAVF